MESICEVSRTHGVCGPGAVPRINDITYVAVCANDYVPRLNVQFMVNLQHTSRQHDLDHLWSPIQDVPAITAR